MGTLKSHRQPDGESQFEADCHSCRLQREVGCTEQMWAVSGTEVICTKKGSRLKVTLTTGHEIDEMVDGLGRGTS